MNVFIHNAYINILLYETAFDSAFCTINYQFLDLFFKNNKNLYPIWSFYNLFGYIRYPL